MQRKFPLNISHIVPILLLLIPTAVSVLPLPVEIFSAEAANQIWELIPYTAGVAFVFFTMRMNRLAESHIGILLIAAYTALVAVADQAVLAILSGTVPLAITIIAVLSPDQIYSTRSGFSLVATGLAVGYPIAVHSLSWLPVPSIIFSTFLSEKSFRVVPDISVILFLISIGVCALKSEPAYRYFHYAITIAISSLYVAFEIDPLLRIGSPLWMRPVAWSSMYGILLYGTYRLYWQRVYIDDLTGILNRRALDERMRGMKPPYALAMIDIDHFKQFNDTYGHAEGDNVLRWVAKQVHGAVGATAYRYGGEEFTLVYPTSHAGDAIESVDAIRETLANTSFSIRAPGVPRQGYKRDRGKTPKATTQITVTFSAGVSEPTSRKDKPETVIQRADQALYEAKKAGRNQVATG